jgi:hypothetical protein
MLVDKKWLSKYLNIKMYNLDKLIQIENDKRQSIKNDIWNIVLKYCDLDPKGHAKRGMLQELIYKELGFNSRPYNEFRVFVNNTLLERGFRCAQYTQDRVYCGIKFKS